LDQIKSIRIILVYEFNNEYRQTYLLRIKLYNIYLLESKLLKISKKVKLIIKLH